MHCLYPIRDDGTYRDADGVDAMFSNLVPVLLLNPALPMPLEPLARIRSLASDVDLRGSVDAFEDTRDDPALEGEPATWREDDVEMSYYGKLSDSDLSMIVIHM